MTDPSCNIETALSSLQIATANPPCSTEIALNIPQIATAISVALGGELQALKSLGASTEVFRAVQKHDQIWMQLVKARFGSDVTALDPVPPGCPLSPWQARYHSLNRTINALSDEAVSNAAWGNDHHYWTRKKLHGSVSQECMCLHNVCWLDVTSAWKGVTAGTYVVVWRMQIGSRIGSMSLKMGAYATASRDTMGNPLATQPPAPPGVNTDDTEECAAMRVAGSGERVKVADPVAPVDVSASDWDGMFFRSTINETQLLQAREAAGGEGGWVEIEAGTVVVPPGSVIDVWTRMYDISNYRGKSNIAWDYVALERVPDGAMSEVCLQ